MYMGNWFSDNNKGRKARFEQQLKWRQEKLRSQISDEKINKLMFIINTEIKKLRKQGWKAYAIIKELDNMGYYDTIYVNDLKIEDPEIQGIIQEERRNDQNMW